MLIRLSGEGIRSDSSQQVRRNPVGPQCAPLGVPFACIHASTIMIIYAIQHDTFIKII
jgi:hypothetical protein